MSNQPLKIVYTPISDLIPYARNSRTHNDAQVAQIAASIREFGFTNPILTDESGGIIAGHGRVMAARKLGMAEVPTITLVGLTETQKRAYVIADNKLALNAGWDEETLLLELHELSEANFNLTLTGFDSKELTKLFPNDFAESFNEKVPEDNNFTVLIECGDEKTQQEIYAIANERGLECKIMN